MTTVERRHRTLGGAGVTREDKGLEDINPDGLRKELDN